MPSRSRTAREQAADDDHELHDGRRLAILLAAELGARALVARPPEPLVWHTEAAQPKVGQMEALGHADVAVVGSSLVAYGVDPRGSPRPGARRRRHGLRRRVDRGPARDLGRWLTEHSAMWAYRRLLRQPRTSMAALRGSVPNADPDAAALRTPGRRRPGTRHRRRARGDALAGLPLPSLTGDAQDVHDWTWK